MKKKPPEPPDIFMMSKRRRQRIREVQELHDGGWTADEIAELYGITTRMVIYDLRDGKTLDMALSKEVNQGEVLGREIRSYERAMKAEWRNYYLAGHPLVRVAIMRNIIALKEKYIKFLQSAGLLDKVAEKVYLNLDKTDLSDFTKEELEVIASAGLKLTKAPEDE